jgi:hypothetical protein
MDSLRLEVDDEAHHVTQIHRRNRIKTPQNSRSKNQPKKAPKMKNGGADDRR